MRTAILILFAAALIAFLFINIGERLGADSEAPVISSESDEISVSVSATDEELLEGITAVDNEDGDVSDSLLVLSKSKFISGTTINVSYAAFDSSDNVATYTRKVTYTDYTSPEFSLSSPLKYKSSDSSIDYFESLSAYDVIDGDISSSVRYSVGTSITSSDDTVYTPVTFQVTNSSGDTSSVSLEAVVYSDSDFNRAAPSLSEYIVYVDKGTRIDAEDYIDGILTGKTKSGFSETDYTADDIVIDDSDYNYNTAGTYQINYTLYSSDGTEYDESGVELGTTTLFVVVRE